MQHLQVDVAVYIGHFLGGVDKVGGWGGGVGIVDLEVVGFIIGEEGWVPIS